ncbi:hypothetical protein PS903_04894 [Pseudomonas fluorescens]|nr:hypothetical protein PS903_04894 [Pseudomonas fluorescens]
MQRSPGPVPGFLFLAFTQIYLPNLIPCRSWLASEGGIEFNIYID